MDYHIELRAFSDGQEPPLKSQLTLWVRPGAAEEYMVRLEIGALGANRRTTEWGLQTMTEAVARMREIITAQRQNGFEVVMMSRDHPLREWLDSEQVPDDAEEERGNSKKPVRPEQLSLF